MEVLGEVKAEDKHLRLEKVLVQKPVGESMAPAENQKLVTIKGEVAVPDPDEITGSHDPEVIMNILGESF